MLGSSMWWFGATFQGWLQGKTANFWGANQEPFKWDINTLNYPHPYPLIPHTISATSIIPVKIKLKKKERKKEREIDTQSL